ncbi:MAG TPA: amidohydrolase family protein [Alphaproteobacteria bacterium]|jgi:predicted TIM-barrel fold metal-dependent hydrolase
MGSIDADAHVIENPLTFEYIEEADKKLRPMVVQQVAGNTLANNEGGKQTKFWVIDGRVQPMEGNIGSNTSEESREMRDVSSRLAHMDELEIDVQVLFPTVFLRAWTQNEKIEYALCRSYNRWLADIWKKAGDRLRWAVMPPLLSSWDKVRAELEFAKAHGACSIFLRGLEIEKKLSDEHFYPLWEMAEDLDLAVAFHSGNNSFAVRDIYKDETGFSRSKLPVVGAFHSLLMEGIPTKFPKVRWGFVEVSAQWLPYALNDLELRFKRRGKRFPKSPLKENNMWVACQTTDDLPYIIKHVGDDHLVIGTDYGHADTSAQIEALRLIRDNGTLPKESVDKILDANSRRFYGLN